MTTQEKCRQEIAKYRQMLEGMNQISEDYLYLLDFDAGLMYFPDKINDKYVLPCATRDGIPLQAWADTIYPRDKAAVMEAMGLVLGGKKRTHRMEYRLTNRSGNRVWVSCSGKVLCDGEGHPFMMLGCVSEAVLGRKTDALTGFLNKHKYLEDIAAVVSAGGSGCLLVFGPDDFKNINIKYGRLYGDQTIRQIAKVLEREVPAPFMIYRLDGDRFGLNLAGQGRSEAELIYGRIQAQMAERCTISASAVLYGGELHTSAETLYQYAESALDYAKQHGKNRLVFFSSDIYEEQRGDVELLEELRRSIRSGFRNFSVSYQPQVDIGTCEMVGVEALLRYYSPKYGDVRPDEFIPLLEKSGLICPVGEWVLKTALAQCRSWRKQLPSLRVSVNISYVQLQKEDFPRTVLRIFRESQLPEGVLTLEVTESMQIQDYQRFNDIFSVWKKEGICIAIDDFGTGYSSLGYLNGIAANEVKIDRYFVRNVQHSAYNFQLLKKVIEFARNAQLRVCCEGVETEEELLALRELMPDTIQGYLFSAPCGSARFEEMYIRAESAAYQKRAAREEYCRTLFLRADEEQGKAEPGGLPDRHYEDILRATELGLWVIRLHEDPAKNEMFADRTMCRVMGLKEMLTPTQCFQYWYSRINEGYYHYVNEAVDKIIRTGHILQLEYTWNHPKTGEVVVRCVGVRSWNRNGYACIEGYHRIISNVDRPRSMPNGADQIVFEYNERRRSAYFHAGTEMLGLQTERVADFPECWIRSGLVHPDFAADFRDLFSEVREKEDTSHTELLLRNGRGAYEWFRLRTARLSNDSIDQDTIAITLEASGRERIAELENRRKMDFYEAMLSETIAYAEIETVSGRVQTAGGFWMEYENECRQEDKPFTEIFYRHLEQTVAPEDVEQCRRFFREAFSDSRDALQSRTRKKVFRRTVEGGEYHWVEMVIHTFSERYTGRAYALVYLKDINSAKQKELALQTAASMDPLTAVYNGQVFRQEVTHFMLHDGSCGALLVFDLDNFKSINDSHGHPTGDDALRRIADVLRRTFRQQDIVGRLGGDEFGAFIKNVTGRKTLDARLGELFRALKETDGIPITCSIGVTIVPRGAFSYSVSMEEADAALYYSKQLGKNRASYYADLMMQRENKTQENGQN